MNARERRYVKRLAKSIAGGENDPKAQQERPREVLPLLAPETKWQLLLRHPGRLIALVSSLVTIVGIYVYLPSWSLTLPTSAYRPHNPYTAVFGITNQGSIPAREVKVRCILKSIHYLNPAGTHSSGFTSEVADLGTLGRNESRTFTCPQSVFHVDVTPGVMTPDEVKRQYEEQKQWFAPDGHYIGPDMPFDFADFELDVLYAPLIPVTLTSRFQVVARPGETGTLVWERIDIHKKI